MTKLLDAVAQHHRYPDTFEIPPARVRSSLRPGDTAKVVFLYPEGGSREWVDVTRVVSPGVYVGTHFEDGSPDTVRFSAKNIIDSASRSEARTALSFGIALQFALLAGIAYGGYRLLR